MNPLTRALELIDRNDVLNSYDEDLECLEDDEDKFGGENRFQNENIYNRLLPYDITEECQDHLMQIKTSLATCIQLDQETVYEWLIDLERFVDLYGLSFSKEDHIYFIKIQYELIVSENRMDLYHITYVARCFSRLMRKRYLITSDDLVLDWRPLYETYERLLFSETESLGLRFVPENLEANLSQAIRLARPHFPINATQEMLDEWRPMLCPYSVAMQRAVTYLNLFLPTTLPPEHHEQGFRLWFDEVMQMWLNGKISAGIFESKFTLLLSRLSSDCLGFIDWEPYIPQIFNHFKSSLNLNGPIGRSPVRRSDPIDVGPCAQWMVYMINRNSSCLDYIARLFKAIESYYHPSNTDRRWHLRLQQLLTKLPACFIKRLYRERHKKNVWSRRVPDSHRLTEEQTSKFVDSILPVVLTSMFNQAGITSASQAFRDLAALRPEKVVPPLLERLYGSLETLTEPHRLLATINCTASAIPAMVRPCKFFPEGPSHVVPLLLNSLPGIDSNDMKKCIAVFRFVATLSAHVQMKDYSYLVDERPDLTFEQQQLCLSTAQFEDFVIKFLDKCFVLIENTASVHSLSNLDHETQLKNGEENIVEAAISSVTLSILAQASPQIQLAAMDKLYSHVTRHIFDTKTQGKAIALLCLACAKSLPKQTLEKFIPHFSRLALTLMESDEVFQESKLDDELLFSLLLLSEIVRCNSPHLLDHKTSIVAVLQRALKLTAKEGYMLGCGTLRHILRALTNIACCDWRNIDFEDEEHREIEKKWPFDNWGHTTHVKDLKLKWEIPGPDSRAFAQELLEMFLRGTVQNLLDWTNGKRKLSREEVQRSLHIVMSSLVGSASVLSDLKSTPISLCPLEVPVIPLCIRYTGTEPLEFSDGTNVRTWIVSSMIEVMNYLLTNSEDDTKSLALICDIFSTAISYFGYNKTELRLAAQRIKSMKTGTQNKLLGSKRHLRYLLVERVAQQHRAMLLNKGQPEFTQLHLDVFKCLFNLAQSHYVEVRVLAQDTVYMMFNYFPFLEELLVPMIVEALKQPKIEHNKFKGLLYLAIGRRSYNPLVLDPNWSILGTLWPTIVQSPHSEKPSIVKLLDRICSLVQKGFDTFELKHSFSDNIKKIAATLWTSESIDLKTHKPPSDELIISVGEKVKQRNVQRVKDYEQLVIKLAELIEDLHMHWHRRIVAYSLFTHLMRDDHPLPLSGLNLCLSSLISDRLSIRTKAVQLAHAQLKLLKRRHSKRTIRISSSDSAEITVDQLGAEAKRISINENEPSSSPTCGQQQQTDCESIGNSNKWMQYDLSEGNYSKEEWDKMIFIDKPHIGFYAWPKELKVYEPYEKQPQLDRPIDDLNEFELAVYRKFTDSEFVEKLVNYFCFEDNKGSPETHRFDTKRPILFKGLFRNYGPCMIEPFKKYVLEYSTSACEYKQKFVIEFIAGLIRGSKHWSYDMMNQLKEFVMPLLDRMTVTQENYNDWTGLANYVFRNRDIRRFKWLLSYFITKATSQSESISPTITPFIQTSRLTLAHYALIQCEWRAVDHIFPIVINNLKDQNHLLAYANVRTCLASIYSLIYMFDDATTMSRIPGTLANCPKRAEFIESLLPRLAILKKSKQSPAHLVVGADNQQPMDEDSKSQFVDTMVPTVSSAVAPTPLSSDVSDEANILIAGSLIKFPQSDSNQESPTQSNKHQHHHLHAYEKHRKLFAQIDDESKINEKTTTGIGSGVDGSFVEDMHNTLPNLSVSTLTAGSDSSGTSALSEESQERKDAIKLMKLTSCWIIYNVCRMKSPVPADYFKLMPVICEMGRENSDPELAADSLAAVAVLGGSTLSPQAVDESLSCVKNIIANHSWHARAAAAAFIEIIVSSNLFRLLSNEKWQKEIEDIVINHLICDERIEVRESSSLTLSGLIHCEFTKLTPKLIQKFKQRASEPLVRKKQPNGTVVLDMKSIVARHSGILCLCACVDAHPYTVPDYLPEILTFLCDQLTDPQPISTTIKKTMTNFRRTHHDNWQSDKTKFTDDQLSILADLLVSPSYYA